MIEKLVITGRRYALALGCAFVLSAGPVMHAHAQSADLVLCDRLAADPDDPDRPADIKGVAKIAASDIPTAIKFCRTASGSRRALYNLGRAYAVNQQPQDAIAAWRKAADKGSTIAMIELGVLYADGNGVAKDEAQAKKLFQRASDAGNPRGVMNLAALTERGGGAAMSPQAKRELLQKAAIGNSPEAQYQLGLMLEEGAGGPKDEAGARALYEKASQQNHAAALERLGAFALSGRGGPKDEAAGRSFLERSAALGNDDAKLTLKRAECPYQIRDKSGKNRITDLCF